MSAGHALQVYINGQKAEKLEKPANNKSISKSYSEHPFGRFMLEPSKGREETRGSSRIHGFLKMLRRKFRKEKRCFGSGCHSNPFIVPYNSYTYSMNFDVRGLSLAEPRNL